MDMRSLARPAAQLLRHTTTRSSTPSLISIRGHKTTARTKRALKIAPHDSFLPNRANPPTEDSIIYNPPASESTPFHTPFLFLPSNDPRRAAIERMRESNADGLAGITGQPQSDGELPPGMKYPRRTAKYGLVEEQLAEMRKLRNEDPLTWSVNSLARKFNCSPMIVKIAAPAPAEHLEWLKGKMERKKERWGPIKTKAREDRKTRAEMLYRGEI